MMWPFNKKEEQPQRIDVGSITEGTFDELSPTWIYIKKYLEKRIAQLREDNDSLNLDDRKTASLRGRIQEAKELASLPETLSRDMRLKNTRQDAGEEDTWS